MGRLRRGSKMTKLARDWKGTQTLDDVRLGWLAHAIHRFDALQPWTPSLQSAIDGYPHAGGATGRNK